MKNSNRFLAKASLLLAMLAFVLVPLTSYADTFNLTLRFGSRGSEVRSLQSFLGIGADGIFGRITKAAVIRYQSSNGLAADGIVGPMTRSVLNGGQSNNGQAPTISSVYVNTSRNSAIVNWSTNTPAQGIVYYSTSPLTTYERENSVDVSGLTAMTDSNQHSSQGVSISNLQTGTTYYYLVYVTGQNGNVSVTWPSTFMTSN
ncbi:MAG: peptidoglycan-binding protein [Patescibacteria group bacterium]